MALSTLRFPSYPVAVAAAKALNFWDEEADQLRTDGQSVDPQTGDTFGWSIAYCGPEVVTPAVTDETGEVITPAALSTDVFVIVTGQLPPDATPYLDPRGYGYSGHLFAGTEPGPHP
jgi:hypothetical protein